MKHLRLLFILLSGITINLSGQEHSIGIQEGVNLTNLTAFELFEDSKFRTGMIGGINYEFLINDRYSLGADLLYSQQGFKDKFFVTDEFGNIIRGADTKDYYDYLMLPLKFGYSVGHHLKGSAKVGLYPSILLKAESSFPKFDADGNMNGYEVLNVKENMPKFDLGGCIELGADYGMNDHLRLFTSVSY